MQVNKEQVLLDAISNFGVENQMTMVIEECSELIQAICKIKRTFTTEQLELFNDETTCKFDSVKDALLYCNMCSEIADVRIMIQQLEKMFSLKHIEMSEERKLMRLEGRIEKYKKDFSDGNLKHGLTR